MGKRIVRKLIMVIPTMLFLTALIFLLLYTVLGDPVVVMLGRDADPQTVAGLRASLGFNRPIAVQYWDWLTHVVQGQWGVSYRNAQPVSEAIAQRLPATLELTFLAMAIAFAFALICGITAARHPNSRLDFAISLLTTFGLAMPNFWIGILLIILFGLNLHILPSSGYVPFLSNPMENLKGMILPSITLSLAYFGSLTRITRANMLNILTSDYIRTARAKGLTERGVLWKHALKNSLLPVLTILGVDIGPLFGGAVVTESLFAIPGVGRLLVSSISGRDFSIVQAIVVVVTAAVLFTNLAVDIAYSWLDPRIRYR